MFTGLVEESGHCLDLQKISQGTRLRISAPMISEGIEMGDSVSVNGCCLTVTSCDGDALAFDLLEETLRCTNLGDLSPGSPVNLERALPADGRLGGHFVQGHVDAAIVTLAVEESGADLKLQFELPKDAARYVAHKGSVAINGVSLTVASVETDRFTIWIIPHTREVTNLGQLQIGDRVNMETDILAKYAERILKA